MVVDGRAITRSSMRMNGMRLALKSVIVGIVLVLAAVHLLFAGANFQIGEPAEGVVAALAGISLLSAVVLVVRGAIKQAALWVLLGTLPLTIWFAFTVPQGWSALSLLIASCRHRPLRRST
jgi:hypothetical protein